jgi:hypothetical protein
MTHGATRETSDDDARWEEAAQIAKSVGEAGLFPRRVAVVVWIGLAVVVMILFATVLVIPPILAGDENGSADWPSVPILVSLIGAGMSLGGLAWAIKTNRFYSQWHSVISPLTTRDRRSVQRQFAGKERALETRVPVLRAIAQQERRTTQAVVPVSGGVILSTLGGLIDSDGVFIVVSSSGLLCMSAVMVVHLVVRYRQAGEFLLAHDSPKSSR